MKKGFLLMLILISLNAISQKFVSPKKDVDTSSQKKDSITEKTVFQVSVGDFNRYLDKMKDKVSARQYESILAGVQLIISSMISENKQYFSPTPNNKNKP